MDPIHWRIQSSSNFFVKPRYTAVISAVTAVYITASLSSEEEGIDKKRRKVKGTNKRGVVKRGVANRGRGPLQIWFLDTPVTTADPNEC